MKLIKTSLYSAFITLIKIGSGFVASKIVAVFTGPAGVATIGAFTNFITIILAFANGAINTGVVKYTSEYKDDQIKSGILFSTALKISIYCSVVIGVVLLAAAPYLSALIFRSDNFVMPVRTLGFTIILYSLNSLLISILNGKSQIKTYTLVNTAGSIIGLILTLILVYFFKLLGAIYALVLTQSIVFFVTATLIYKSEWFKWEYFKQPFDSGTGRLLLAFSLMTIVTALTGPVTQLLLRNMLIDTLGIDKAGDWQGMMRISDGYLMVITTSLSVYYLPRLSELTDNNDIRQEIFHGLKLILPALFVGCAIIYYLRFFIIRVLYTSSFLEMETLFFWQLAGDFLKMAAWVIGYLMIAKAMTKLYIFTDIIFSISYVIFGFVFVRYLGLEGISIAFAVNYLLYLLAIVFIFRKLLFNY